MKKLHFKSFLVLLKSFITSNKSKFSHNSNGQNSLEIEGGEFQELHQIPSSVYFNTRSGEIKVGSNTVFGERCLVLTGKHKIVSEVTSFEKLHEVPESGRDITIGKNCYIGSAAILIGPLVVGDYSVVGAGSVVTHDVPSFEFHAGNPAKRIRSLTAGYKL